MSPAVREVVLARLWQDGRHARELRATDGRRVEIVYRGVWTHGDGPDFRDALLDIGGELRRGAVELHVYAADWHRHGHHLDASYDDVILHVVLVNDLARCAHGPNGRAIVTLDLSPYLSEPLERLVNAAPAFELGALGTRACLPTLAGDRETAVRDVLRRAGWRRLTGKQLRLTQEFERTTPGQALYAALLDGLGLVSNRSGMACVAEALPVQVVERADADLGAPGVLAALLGVGGFLPLVPQHAALVGLDPRAAAGLPELFETLADAYELTTLPSNTWSLGRVRPANHPARRLASAASLLAGSGPGGLLDAVTGRSDGPADGWRRWFGAADPPIGRSRADQLAVNVIAPFLAAYADAAGDTALAEHAGRLWETLPGTADDAVAEPTLRQIAGERVMRITSAIEAQGLHQIGRHGCAQLRCFECPIAELAVRHEPRALT